jgi:hypothetical protein
MIYGPLDEISLPGPLTSAFPNPVSFHTLNTDIFNLRERFGVDAALGRWSDNWVTYQHVNTAFCHPGVGNPSNRRNLPQSIASLVTPFDHDPTGYKAMLIDAQVQYEAGSNLVEEAAAQFEKGRQQLATVVRFGTMQAKTLFKQVQGWVPNL